jgi:hypothetical protein
MKVGSAVGVAACLGFGLIVGVAACSRGASYPDGDKVTAAQQKWCTTLAGIVAPGDGSWEHKSACESTYPTASGQFLSAMADCFRAQAEQTGAGSFEAEQAIKDCTELSLTQIDLAGVEKSPVLDARCERMARCEGISDADCRLGFEGLAPSEQSRLTRMYNQGALADVASCLSGGCDDDEEAAKAACYEDVYHKRAWLPEAD